MTALSPPFVLGALCNLVFLSFWAGVVWTRIRKLESAQTALTARVAACEATQARLLAIDAKLDALKDEIHWIRQSLAGKAAPPVRAAVE